MRLMAKKLEQGLDGPQDPSELLCLLWGYVKLSSIPQPAGEAWGSDSH